MTKENGPITFTDAQREHLKTELALLSDLAAGSVVMNMFHDVYDNKRDTKDIWADLKRLGIQPVKGATYYEVRFLHKKMEREVEATFHYWKDDPERMPVVDSWNLDFDFDYNYPDDIQDNYTLITYDFEDEEFLSENQLRTWQTCIAGIIGVLPDGISAVLPYRETVMSRRSELADLGCVLAGDALYIEDYYMHEPSGLSGSVVYHIWEDDPGRGLVVDTVTPSPSEFNETVVLSAGDPNERNE